MKPKTLKKKPDVQNMSLDNFLDNMDADLSDSGGSEAEEKPDPPKKKKVKLLAAEPPTLSKKQKKLAKKAENGKEKIKAKKQKKKPDPVDVGSDPEEEVVENGGQKDVEREHKQALSKLQETDPELYAFLKKNDKKLLKFGSMAQTDEDGDDSDDEEDGDDDLDLSDDEEGKVHELPDKLEVASDESDFEEDDEGSDDEEGGEEAGVEPGTQTKLTLKMLKKWTEQLTAVPLNAEIIRTACKAFNSVLVTVTGETNVLPPFKAEGSAIFNAVVQLCVLHLSDAVKNYLNITSLKGFKTLQKSKKFVKIRSCLRTYLVDLTNLLENVSSSHILNVLLKHLHQFSSIMVAYPTTTKPILKRLVIIWSTSEEESVRVLAFLCILKITNLQRRQFLSDVLKNMYLAYVKNSKFVSPNTLPGINFMRRSLTEMFTMDLSVSYQHVFLYIRQLAIHLRNAVILQKKDSFQYIYNWQYINSLKLWSDVLAATFDKKELEPLIYPLVSIIHGVIKLIPSAQYFPLRFHCCRMLVDITARTRVFIPVLPFLVEVLSSNSFNEEHKKLSMKPVNLTCLLRFAPANIQENAFKDAVLDQIYELSLEYLAHESYSIAFPDLAVPIVTALRSFCRTTKVYKYSRKIKQLSDKIAENSQFIEKQRRAQPVKLNDVAAIQAWEATRKANGTPLLRFFETFAKENEKNKRRQANQSEDVEDYELPTIKKVSRKREREEGPAELFPSDDEDGVDGLGDLEELEDLEDEEEEEAVPKKKSKKEKKGKSKAAAAVEDKKKKKKQAVVAEAEEFPLERSEDGEQVDILKDITAEDWD